MLTDNLHNLEQLGLQPNEARIYLALLELGKGTASQIVKAAHLNRTTAYDILERLCLYGLANRSTVGKKRMYIAEPPSRLQQYLQQQKRKVEMRLERVQEVLPDLQTLYKTDLKPSIGFFDGMDGINNIYRHALEAKSVVYSILDLSQYLPEMDQFGKEHVRDRVRLGVREQVLVRRSKEAEDFYTTTYRGKKAFIKNTEYRWLEHAFPASPAAEIMIFDDTVIGVFFKPGEKSAFEIKSASFANSLKVMFELVWQESTEVNKKK